MWRLGLALGAGLLAAVVSLPADMQESAWRARAMLGPEHWACVLRIERVRPQSASRQVRYALVFELEDRLWFYADDEGTQSLSLWRGHLVRDKADLGPLLKEIDPGYVRHEFVPTPPVADRPPAGPAPLPQGCFIACVAYLQSLAAAGRRPEDARLLSYYGAAPVGSRGHTVLYYTENGRRYYYDPQAASSPAAISDRVPTEALAIARAAAPGRGYARPERAVFLPLRPAAAA